MKRERYKKIFKEQSTSNYNWLQVAIDQNQKDFINFQHLQNLIPEEVLFYKENSSSDGLETDCHITVFYGLVHSEDYYAIQSALTNFGEIEVLIGKINKFQQNDCDVIYIECFSQQLEDIHYYIKENFENENEHDIYTPHITLAYVQPNSCDYMIGNNLSEGYRLYFNEILFYDVNGDKYQIDLNVN